MYGATNYGAAVLSYSTAVVTYAYPYVSNTYDWSEAAPPKAALELNRKERRAARSKQRRQK